MWWIGNKARKTAQEKDAAIYRELKIMRFEMHQILRHISGEPMEIRFLSRDERKRCAMELRYQYRGIPEEKLPDDVRIRLDILESPSLVGYGDLRDKENGDITDA